LVSCDANPAADSKVTSIYSAIAAPLAIVGPPFHLFCEKIPGQATTANHTA